MSQKNKLQVEAIFQGTVIDHIPAQVAIKLLRIFKLLHTTERVTIGLNLPSNQQNKKDLIKLENVFLNEDQANQLSIYAPLATVNRIKNYIVISKQKLKLPKIINGILSCPNENCISRCELKSSDFFVRFKINKIYLQCKYCERDFEHKIVIFNNI